MSSLEKYKDKSIDALCRACLELLEDDTLCLKHDIFFTPDLAKKLIVCTSLTVEPQDGFPKYLCDICYSKVNEFHKFQTMCVNSVQRFREILQYQDAQPFTFEDEKPVFDLEAQTKVEITITEPDILFQSSECKDHLADEVEEDMFESVAEPTPNRRCNSTTDEASETLPRATVDATKETAANKRSRRSTRTRTDCGKEKVDESTGCTETNKNPSSWRDTDGSDAEEQDDWTADDEVQSEQEVNTHKQRRKTKENKQTLGNRSFSSSRNKRKYGKRTGERTDSESKSSKKTQVFQCDICPTRFFVEHRLVAHKRSHDGLMPYPCTMDGCDKGFNRWHCLSEHLKQHEGTNQWYTCEEEGCGKVYKHKPTLSMHLRKFHKKGPELKSHICEICGKVFKASAILNDHRYTHKDKSELPFACSEEKCDRRFSSKEKLKVHMMRHAGIKNYVCPYCGMRKTTRNELKIHINYHTLERTWPCRFCQHVCNSAGNLKMHVRTVHERAKDYACRFCERTFAKPDTRKYHEMTHTGEKPNECKECGKRFTQPAALRTHRKIHMRHRMQTAAAAAQGQEPTSVTCAVDGSGSIELAATAACLTSSTGQDLTVVETQGSSAGLMPQQLTDQAPVVPSHIQNLLQTEQI